jgi:hypothetical protein
MTTCTATFGARAPVKSYGGNRCLLTITDDDYTRWFKVYSMKLKSEARECFINFEKEVKLQHGKDIQWVRLDNGGQYGSAELHAYVKSKGITFSADDVVLFTRIEWSRGTHESYTYGQSTSDSNRHKATSVPLGLSSRDGRLPDQSKPQRFDRWHYTLPKAYQRATRPVTPTHTRS